MFGVVRSNAAAVGARNALRSATNLRSFCNGLVPKCPDVNLVKTLDYEIKLRQLLAVMPAAPADFPFKARNPFVFHHEQRMSRNFEDELIRLDVGRHDSDVDLNVEIWTEGKGMVNIVATASADEVSVQRVSVTKGGDLLCSQLYIRPESEMQAALREFLEARGIKKSCYGYLHEFMEWNSQLPKTSSSYDGLPREVSQQNVDSLTNMKKVIEAWLS